MQIIINQSSALFEMFPQLECLRPAHGFFPELFSTIQMSQ
jgi:hypothetical protein